MPGPSSSTPWPSFWGPDLPIRGKSVISFQEFHDATLMDVHVDWPNGEIRIAFRVCSTDSHTISLLGVSLMALECTRMFPWGRSFSVNEIRMEAIDELQRVTIELQSGDLITATCRDFGVVRADNERDRSG